MKHQSRILVVDDEPVVGELIQTLLAPESYDIAFAYNGHEALEKVSQFLPDLVLLDLTIPGVDGLEVCRLLRQNKKTAEISIIIITASQDRSVYLDALKAGADDFISKPINRSELRARVRTVVRLSRYRRLLAERAKFKHVVEWAEEGYLLINGKDEITFANTRAQHYLAQSMGEEALLGASFLSLAQSSYQLQPEEAWRSWPNETGEAMMRYMVQPESATTKSFWLQVETVNYLSTETGSAWIVCLKDVTVEMESQRDIRKFHTVVYHKLRTPLIGMLGGLEMIASKADTLPPETVQALSTTAFEQARQLFQHVEDVIRYIKAPTLARAGLGFELAGLAPVLKKLSLDLDMQSIQLAPIPDILADAEVILSPQAMELILWAILENARKFHPEQNPRVMVALLFDEGTEMVMLQVKDDGQALSPTQLLKAWTPYYQGEKYFTGQVEGMGLGLSMVASLVWGVGGSCRMYNRGSKPGVVVELQLPMAE